MVRRKKDVRTKSRDKTEEINSTKIQRSEILQNNDLLSISLDTYADLFDFAPAGYIVMNTSGIIEKINFTAAEMLDVNKKNIEGFSILSLLHKDSHKTFLNHISSVRHSDKTAESDISVITAGKTRYFTVVSKSFIDFNIKRTLIRSVLFDITKKKEKYDSLSFEEERFRNITDNFPVMVWMGGPDKNCYYFNKKFFEFTGKTREELFGVKWLKDIHPDEVEQCLKTYDDCFENKTEYTSEYRYKNYNSEYRTVYENAVPFFNLRNIFLGYIGCLIDVTDERMIKKELENTAAQKEIFIKEIHHRVKNHLQTITSLINIESNEFEPSVKEVFDKLKNRIRAVANIHDYFVPHHSENKVDLHYFIHSLIKETHRINLPDIKIEYDIAEVEVSQQLAINIGMIINELISNSLKHAFEPSQQGIIKISFCESENAWVLNFSDNGKGLPAEKQMDGKSFGMMLVNLLVHQHGGRLEMPQQEKGVSYIFEFPAAV